MPVVQAEEGMQPPQVATACPDPEKLRRDLFAAYSEIAELDERRMAQLDEIDSVEDEIKANCYLSKVRDEEMSRLTAEIGRWECAVTVTMEQFAAELQAKEKIQRELVASSSHIGDLERRYDAQCIHNELQTLPEHTITFLTTAFMQARGKGRTKAAQIATARRDLERLLRLLSTPTIIVPERYVPRPVPVSSSDVGPWGGEPVPCSAKHGMRLLSPKSVLEGASLAKLRAAECRIATLQTECDNQSKKLDSLRNDLQVSESKIEELKRTITTLTAKCDQRKRAAETMAEKLAAIRRDIEKCLGTLTAFSPHIADLQRRYDVQSKAIRDQFQTKTSLLEHIIAFLTQSEDRAKTEQITTARTKASLLGYIIACFTTASIQAESGDGAKTEQIATARRDLEHLQCVLFEQMTSLQERYEAQSQELKSFRDKLHSILKLHQPT